MLSLAARTSPKVRAIAQSDLRRVLRMIDTAWRVSMRVSPLELSAKLKTSPGFLIEDHVGLRGFMMVEPHPPSVALVMATGVHDTWKIEAYLDLLLPEIERAVRLKNLTSLVYIGGAPWLIDELQQRGFETREWIVAFERAGADAPPSVPEPAMIRTAHAKDLPALLTLDTLTFDHIWRKSLGNFNRGLANADSFMLAEIEEEIVGYEWCEIYHHRAHLTRLAVHPNYQGRGIGAQLLHRAITDALQHHVDRMTLNTQETNRRSRSLYHRFGFVDTNQRMPVLWKDME
jgi:ribosomal-protein-alanine N-acetyltransferase